MHLKEGVRGYFKLQSAKRGSERFSAPEVSDFRAQYRISRLGLDIVPKGNDFGQFLLYSFYPPFFFRKGFGSGHKNDHHFSVITHTPHYMAQASFPCLFIIDGNPVLLYKPPGKLKQAVIFFFLNSTGGNRYDVMATLPVAAERRFPLYETCRYGHFISVRERMHRRKHGPHQFPRFAGDTLYHIFYTAVFHIELPFIGEMGKLAAAAVFINGTLRHHAERRFLLYGKQFPQGIRFFQQNDFRGDRFSGKRPENKYGESVHTPDPFPMNTQIPDCHRVYFMDSDLCRIIFHTGVSRFPVFHIARSATSLYRYPIRCTASAALSLSAVRWTNMTYSSHSTSIKPS